MVRFSLTTFDILRSLVFNVAFVGFVDVGVGGQGAQLEEELSYRVDHVMLAGH